MKLLAKLLLSQVLWRIVQLFSVVVMLNYLLFQVGQEAAVNVRYTVVDPLPKTRTVYYTVSL